MVVLRTRNFVLWLLIVAIFFVLFFPLFISDRTADTLSYNNEEQNDFVTQPVDLPTEILFTGDIMLGRDVERRNQASDLVNALTIFSNFLEYDAVVINLEGPVPDRHVPTPDFGFQFSIRSSFMPLLKSAGVTHVGLANNHTYDHGRLGYEQTLTNVLGADLVPFGHPSVLDNNSVTYIDTEHGRIAVVGIHTLFRVPTQQSVDSLFTEVSDNADFVVVYIHWGEEYELEQNNIQRQLAESLVAAGADVIIGHHPHVVQGIELVSGVPVIYSIGNTIFDQYFSQDVQEGLLVSLELTNDTQRLILHPITSIGTPTHPRKMEGGEQVRFLQDLATRSSSVLSDEIMAGVISW